MSATPNVGAFPSQGTWTLDPFHSTVAFKITHHAVGTFRGGFKEFDAEFDAAKGTLNGSAKIDSVDVFDMLKDHLLSEDFLDAAKYPTVTFESTSVKGDNGQLTVDGNLTFRGVTKPVTARGSYLGPSQVAGWEGPNSEHLGVDLEFEIDRRDYGMSFNNELLDGQDNLGWNVTLDFSLEFSTPLADS